MNETGGIIAINKEQGMTSHDVVNKIRRLYNTKQVGHTGTLDPMATGVLLVMVGRAVKASEYISGEKKSYRAVLRLGITTDTGDITGKVTSEFGGELPDYTFVRSAVLSFIGKSEQIPPMYSALKVNGQKLYELARQGIEIERQGREIEIYSLSCESTDSRTDYIIDVQCSKGTYIRTLCEDIGKKLGVGGTMAALTRTEQFGIRLEECRTLSQLEELTEEERYSLLLPVEQLFNGLPSVTLTDFFARLAHSGCEIYQKKAGTAFAEGNRVKLYDKDGFFALGEVRTFDEGSAIKPVKLFRI